MEDDVSELTLNKVEEELMVCPGMCWKEVKSNK